MSKDINSVVIVGRLTRDSELIYTTSGFAICKISIAVNRTRKKGDQWIEEGNFFDVSLLGKRGESLSPYLKKGQQITVLGELRQERWEQEGAKRSKVTIEAKDIQLLGSRKDTGKSQPQGGQPQQGDSPERFEDDVPF